MCRHTLTADLFCRSKIAADFVQASMIGLRVIRKMLQQTHNICWHTTPVFVKSDTSHDHGIVMYRTTWDTLHATLCTANVHRANLDTIHF